MKRFVLFLCLSFFAHFAEGQKFIASISNGKALVPVPDTVAKAFNKLVSAADSVIWQQLIEEKPVLYQVDFLQEYQWGSVRFNVNGSLEEYTVNVKIDTLPLAARKAIIRRMGRNQKYNPAAIALIQASMWKRWPKSTSRDKRQLINHAFSVSLFLSLDEVRQGWNSETFLVSENGRIKRVKPPRFR